MPDHILDTTEYHVELSPGRTSELRLSNNKRPSLTIHKADAETGEPVEGAVFLVQAADGSTVTEEIVFEMNYETMTWKKLRKRPKA